MIVCVWGDTKEAVAELLDRIPLDALPGSPRVTWRLAESYDGPVGHACFAPGNPGIEEDYREARLRVLREDSEDADAASDDSPSID